MIILVVPVRVDQHGRRTVVESWSSSQHAGQPSEVNELAEAPGRDAGHRSRPEQRIWRAGERPRHDAALLVDGRKRIDDITD
ncbi:hypothetical protein [Sphingomonas faeni]|uniref:hypothetical protein n=1 Tax=Sphingomonas faeni TaxID=185950 RepID=UPI0020C7F6D8|nr:hypothetical protein [Sphingomonas faeni]MCP8890964.1 hypothetical protein [Sphingomonas faeni]